MSSVSVLIEFRTWKWLRLQPEWANMIGKNTFYQNEHFVHVFKQAQVRVSVCLFLRDCAPRWDSARSFYEPCRDSSSLEAANSQALVSTATQKCGEIGNQSREARRSLWALLFRARLCLAGQPCTRPGLASYSRGLAVKLIDLGRLIQKNMNLVGNAFSIPSDLLFVSPARGPTFLCDGEFWTPLQNQAKSFDFHSCS